MNRLAKFLILLCYLASSEQICAHENSGFITHVLIYKYDSIAPISNPTQGEYGFFSSFPNNISHYFKYWDQMVFYIYIPRAKFTEKEKMLAFNRIDFLVNYMNEKHHIDISNRYTITFLTNDEVHKDLLERETKYGNLSDMVIDYIFIDFTLQKERRTEFDAQEGKALVSPLSFKNKGKQKILPKSAKVLDSILTLLHSKLESKSTTFKLSVVLYIYPDSGYPESPRLRATHLLNYLSKKLKDKNRVSIKVRYLSREDIYFDFDRHRYKVGKDEEVGAEIGFGNY